MKLINIIKKVKNTPRIIKLKKEAENIKNGNIIFSRNGLNKVNRNLPEVLVSLTSYPGRIDIVPGTIASLLNQTCKPDRIILWLGVEKFPEKKLPEIYKKLLESGVEIEFREDLKSHTKYFYAMKENPESIIITIDDDRIYDSHLVEKLVESYKKHPDMVSAARVHKMLFNHDGSLKPYNEWIYEYPNHIGTASHSYFATGVGGVLYPPHCLHPEVFNLDVIKEYCHNQDDLWLKVMEVLAGTKVVIAANAKSPCSHNIYGSQTSGQYIENVMEGGNDRQTKAVLEIYNCFRKGEKTVLQTMAEND